MNARTALLLMSLLLPSLASADTEFSSGPEQTLLLELYTSEGCNSCPPAEAYLNGLVRSPELWRDIIPLALHVDYWDGLGWKDRYADPKHTARQHHYALIKSARTVYTPAFVGNGEFWRPGLINRSPPSPEQTVGTLSITVNGQRVDAAFEPAISLPHTLLLNLALLGMDLSTRIEAGENAGRHSEHQFVVLGMTHAVSATGHWQLELPQPKLDAPRYAFAAWISHTVDPTPLQATGGYLIETLPPRTR